MIIPVTIGRSGGSAFAYIIVNFPTTATIVSCANWETGEEFSADEAGLARGQFVFEVPTGEWRINATDGDGTESTTDIVTLTNAGEVAEITIIFPLYILKDGVLADGYTLLKRSGQSVYAVLTNGIIQLNNTNGTNNVPWLLEPATNFEKYNTLYFTVKNIVHKEQYPKKFGASREKYTLSTYSSTHPDIYTSCYEEPNYTDLTVDITNCNGNYYIGMEGVGEFYCKAIWLDK